MTTIDFESLTPNKPLRIEVDGRAVCVARIGEEVFAIGDTCSHSDASLAEGDISGYKIECWLHGAEFDLRTGEAATPPATSPVPIFSVERDGNTVTITSAE